jgi:hypothetical protein
MSGTGPYSDVDGSYHSADANRYASGHLALTPGTRLGVYEVISAIGEGGPP